MKRRWTYAAPLWAAALGAAALGAAAAALLMLALLRMWQPAPAEETAAPAPTAPSAAAAPDASSPAHHLPVDLEMARRELATELSARMNFEAEVSRLREELARSQDPSEASSSLGVDTRHRASGLDAEQMEELPVPPRRTSPPQ